MHLKMIGCQRKNYSVKCRRCWFSLYYNYLTDSSNLIFAAMDTTSSALARFLDLLSTHQDVQNKLRQEIVDARSRHGKLEYGELLGLPYLDAVCRETLRL